MYQDLFKAAQRRHEVALLLRLFPESCEAQVDFMIEIAEHYCRQPTDRLEVVATTTKLLAGLEGMGGMRSSF